MTKLTIPNRTGHYEGDGIEINVFPEQIVVKTTKVSSESHYVNTNKRSSEPRSDDNKSIISSLATIANKFGGNKK